MLVIIGKQKKQTHALVRYDIWKYHIFYELWSTTTRKNNNMLTCTHIRMLLFKRKTVYNRLWKQISVDLLLFSQGQALLLLEELCRCWTPQWSRQFPLPPHPSPWGFRRSSEQIGGAHGHLLRSGVRRGRRWSLVPSTLFFSAVEDPKKDIWTGQPVAPEQSGRFARWTFQVFAW